MLTRAIELRGSFVGWNGGGPSPIVWGLHASDRPAGDPAGVELDGPRVPAQTSGRGRRVMPAWGRRGQAPSGGRGSGGETRGVGYRGVLHRLVLV